MNWFTLPGVLVSISWRIRSALTADMPQIAASTARLFFKLSSGDRVCAVAANDRQDNATAAISLFLIVDLHHPWFERDTFFKSCSDRRVALLRARTRTP